LPTTTPIGPARSSASPIASDISRRLPVAGCRPPSRGESIAGYSGRLRQRGCSKAPHHERFSDTCSQVKLSVRHRSGDFDGLAIEGEFAFRLAGATDAAHRRRLCCH
jgi:hypothetical protein